MRLKTIYFALLALALAGCADLGSDAGFPDGGLNLTLSEDCTVTTKATPSALEKPIASEFRLSVRNSRTGSVAYDGPFCEKIKVRGGDYVITAIYGEDVVLGKDSPFYMGQAEASVTANDPNPSVNIACKVANALVSVCYLDRDGKESTSLFDSYFSNYHVDVAVGDYVLPLRNPRQSAYMRAGTAPSSVTFRGTLADNGREVAFPISNIPSALEAGDNLLLKLSLKLSPSGVILDVQKAEVEKVTVGETIPLEWLPAPKVDGFNGQDQLFHIETSEPSESAVLKFSTSHDLQDMELTFDFGDDAFADLNGTYVLSELTDAQLQRLSTYGVSLPQIGKTYADGAIDIREMVAGMHSDNGSRVDNRIFVRVKANNRWAEKQVTVSAVRPVFNMAAQPAGYAWSHSLYVAPLTDSEIVDAQGADPQSIINAAKYEISTDNGASWTEVTGKDYGLSFVNGLNPGTQYLLRARVGSLTSQAAVGVSTESETEVPNGDFEQLSVTYNNRNVNQGGQYRRTALGTTYGQNTQTFTVSEPTGWGSTNAKTCNLNASNTNSWFVPLSVFNTTIAFQTNEAKIAGLGGNTIHPDNYCSMTAQNGNNAMVLRNVAYSANGTTPSRYTNTAATPGNSYYSKNAPSSISNRAAGKLFLGSYSFSGGQETFNEGVSFATRPASLSGFYKYDTSAGNASDNGKVTVSLLSGNTVIATGSVLLSASGSYVQFNVPLTYTDIFAKATSLRIMISSAADESNIKTTNFTAYIQESYGSVLSVDNLTFTYER